jgi:hypothetical protein
MTLNQTFIKFIRKKLNMKKRISKKERREYTAKADELATKLDKEYYLALSIDQSACYEYATVASLYKKVGNFKKASRYINRAVYIADTQKTSIDKTKIEQWQRNSKRLEKLADGKWGGLMGKTKSQYRSSLAGKILAGSLMLSMASAATSIVYPLVYKENEPEVSKEWSSLKEEIHSLKNITHLFGQNFHGEETNVLSEVSKIIDTRKERVNQIESMKEFNDYQEHSKDVDGKYKNINGFGLFVLFAGIASAFSVTYNTRKR